MAGFQRGLFRMEDGDFWDVEFMAMKDMTMSIKHDGKDFAFPPVIVRFVFHHYSFGSIRSFSPAAISVPAPLRSVFQVKGRFPNATVKERFRRVSI
jgi:hypothetical protein